MQRSPDTTQKVFHLPNKLKVDIENMNVEDIADEIGKTVRGVKTMLTRRGLTCADYDGAARKEKASS